MHIADESRGHKREVSRSSTGCAPPVHSAAIGHNAMSRADMLDAILHSGQVTRVGQHLAIVIFLLVDEKGTVGFSARDLERITGWGKSTILDHLSEIEIFIRVYRSKGRGKHRFELQGVLSEAIGKIASVREPDKTEVDTVRQADTTIVREPDKTVSVRVTEAMPVTTPDKSPLRPAGGHKSVRQADTKKETSPIPPKEKTIPGTTVENPTHTSRACAREVAEKINRDLLQSQLLEACNGALANPAAAPGLLNLGEPIMWLEQGCDLHRDILPTLREVAARNHGGQIKTWRFFTAAVARAKQRREEGLPASPTGVQARSLTPRLTEAFARLRGQRKGGS